MAGEPQLPNLPLKPRHIVIIAVVVILVVVGLLVGPGGFINVPAGHKGVIISSPSGPDNEEIDEGWHWSLRYAVSDIDEVRHNRQTREMVDSNGIEVRSSDNLNVVLDVALIFHYRADRTSDIYIQNQNINDIIDNFLRQAPRNVAANYTGEYIGGEGRLVVEDDTELVITAQLAEYDIVVDQFIIRDIDLPAEVDAAIEEKKASEQQIQTAENRLQATLIEANASRLAAIIEAEGVRNSTIIRANGSAEAVRIVVETLMNADPTLNNATGAYLTWLYLQALTNPDSNVGYIIITDGGGTPVIVDLGQTNGTG